MSTSNQVKKAISYMTDNYGIRFPVTNIRQVIKAIGGKIVTDTSLSPVHPGIILKLDYGFKFKIPPPIKVNLSTIILARLLGHLFLNMGYRIQPRMWTKAADFPHADYLTDEKKQLVLEFAHNFIMPEAHFIKICDKYETDDGSVDLDRVSDFFDVPIDWVVERGVEVGYFAKN